MNYLDTKINDVLAHVVQAERQAMKNQFFGLAYKDTVVMARAIGLLSAHLPDAQVFECLEIALYPGRLDLDAALREAYTPRQCEFSRVNNDCTEIDRCQTTIAPSDDDWLCPRHRAEAEGIEYDS